MSGLPRGMNGRHHAKGVSGGGWPRAAWAAILVLLCGGEQLLLCIEAVPKGLAPSEQARLRDALSRGETTCGVSDDGAAFASAVRSFQERVSTPRFLLAASACAGWFASCSVTCAPALPKRSAAAAEASPNVRKQFTVAVGKKRFCETGRQLRADS